ncbi:hypothetical protein CC80DRAFT_39744 [Byssothecium circinans]|uniref:Uncharacterized protein n=1 Tax=Byssothecium circinans TaxID=147558 RepID=A0A6A5UAB2_9PLEO|nr:hypothetical protein CC80DRAFT_39744 [Byssothecium circinans]
MLLLVRLSFWIPALGLPCYLRFVIFSMGGTVQPLRRRRVLVGSFRSSPYLVVLASCWRVCHFCP